MRLRASLVLATGLLWTTADACSPQVGLYAAETPYRLLSYFDTVFSGRVISATQVSENTEIVTVRTDRVWKGYPPPVVVLSNNLETMCRLKFAAVIDAVFFASNIDGTYHVWGVTSGEDRVEVARLLDDFAANPPEILRLISHGESCDNSGEKLGPIISFSVNQYGQPTDLEVSEPVSIEADETALEAVRSRIWPPGSGRSRAVVLFQCEGANAR